MKITFRIKKLREEREKAAKEAGVVEEKEESEDDDVVTNPFRSIDQQIEVCSFLHIKGPSINIPFYKSFY